MSALRLESILIPEDDQFFVVEPGTPEFHHIFDVIGWDKFPAESAPLYKTRRALAQGVLELRGLRLRPLRFMPASERLACPPVRRTRRKRRVACG